MAVSRGFGWLIRDSRTSFQSICNEHDGIGLHLRGLSMPSGRAGSSYANMPPSVARPWAFHVSLELWTRSAQCRGWSIFLYIGPVSTAGASGGVTQAVLCPQIDHASLTSRAFVHLWTRFRRFARIAVAAASVTCWRRTNAVVALIGESGLDYIGFSCQKPELVCDKIWS